MTPEQRLARVERVLARLAKRGREARSEFRERINILIDTQIRSEDLWRARSETVNEQIRAMNEQLKALAVAQIDLTKSQKLTDQALRSFINSHRKTQNGDASY